MPDPVQNEPATVPPPDESPTMAPPPGASPDVPAPADYEVIREINRGAMGVVYEARSRKLGRLVALKVILSGEHAGADELERFQREAEAIAWVQHPNIVQIFEVGEHAGKPFLALELCTGGSLARRLGGTPLPPKDAARVVQALAGAVQAAHEAHVLHRDLKPANVLLTERGEPKVTDFGLAKRLDEAGKTQTGAVMGTPSYMAPEQALGYKSVGPAADVYALGAVLYECLTGRPPFRAATSFDTIMQVVNDEPVPPTTLNPAVPRDLETVCLKCLHKDAARRYGSASDLADDLGRFLAGEPITARPVGMLERVVKWARRRPAMASLVGVVMLALASMAALSVGLVAARSDAEAKRKAAEHEADKARRARDFLASIFEVSGLEVKGGVFSPFQILDSAERRVPVEFADHPEMQPDLMAALEDARTGLGTPAAMLLEVRGAVELRPRKGAARRPAANALLFTGDRLSLGPEAHARLVILSDLHQEWLTPGREATITRKEGCVPADAVAKRSDDVMWTFALLKKGTFYMGWDGTKGSAKKTEIKEDFEIAMHAVTQGQWRAVMGSNPSHFSRQGTGQGSVSGISDDELRLFPVETVSWNDAHLFIKKLNEKNRGRGYTYRLPTAVEWEYGCRGGAGSEEECSFHFYLEKPTNDLSSDQANFDGNYPAGKAPKGKSLGRPSRVGAYPANKLGLCDMHGNVWQWSVDGFDKEAGSIREFRGGCFDGGSDSCRPAVRYGTSPGDRNNTYGFRLVRVPDPTP